MLKYRLIFGTLMSAGLVGLILLDARLDGSISQSLPNKPIQAPILTLLVCALAVPTLIELKQLIRQTGAYAFNSIIIPGAILMAAALFWIQFIDDYRLAALYLLLVPAFAFLALFGAQAVKFGTEGTVRNVAASLFSMIYVGFLCTFILGIRILWGPWVLLFFIFTVKASDIGAYTLGRLFGTHKMAPKISPGKTWEGLGGAVLFGAVVSIGISSLCGIMPVLQATVFGAVFGLLGQMGDLIESMLKRDAAVKDSSASVPGFGGLLDVIDSPLATAPAAFAALWLLRGLG